MCVWPRWTEKIKTAWSLFISHAWLTPPRRFTKIIISILTPLLKAEPGHWPILVYISQSFWFVKDSLFMVDLERKKKNPYFSLCLPVCENLQGWILWDMAEGSRAREKSHFDAVFLEAKIIIMGLVTNYILKMSGLPALEEVCYDHTMQL